MRESLDEPVSVILLYNATHRYAQPYRLHWQSRDYTLGKVDFYHKTHKGDTLMHHFSLGDVDGTAYFKLGFNATTLQWTIEEYMTADQLEVTYNHDAA